MQRCLITGCAGFIGSHLAERLLAEGWSVYGTARRQRRNLERLGGRLNVRECDMLDSARVEALVAEARPDAVFHLAAQSSVPNSWRQPELTFRVNVFGTLNLLEALRRAAPAATTVVVTSSAVYGPTHDHELPIRESRELRPSSPYGVSKTAADMLARLYGQAYGLKVMRARPFFVTGPRKLGDVCSDFCRGAVEIENGKRQSLDVGNLEAVRDFVDVRDAVEALRLLAAEGQPGEAYNICSGTGTRVSDLLSMVTGAARIPIPVHPDPERYRPLDDPITVGDRSRLSALGWEPRLPIEQTVVDTLEFWRRQALTAVAGGAP
ncbi:MAG: GDP-mannose 4,6-dehydratase [Dehalococcoidia bacterium]|nr:GDP-mannose 4,6-dehydratase [Dehalococcoidia bacterium]